MGAGAGKQKRINTTAITREKLDSNSFLNRGWRFFYWDKHSSDEEVRINNNHELVKGLEVIERVLFYSLKEKGIDAPDNIDVCFFQEQRPENIEDNREVYGSLIPNDEGRLQIALWLGQGEFKEAMHSFVHEYYHALQFEYLFGKDNHDYRDKPNDEIMSVINKYRKTFPYPISEALADTFPIRVIGGGGSISVFKNKNDILPYDELRVSNEYAEAINLKMFFMDCLNDKIKGMKNTDILGMDYYYDCLKGVKDENINSWDILEKSFIDNGHGNLKELYENWRLSFIDK